MSVLKIRANTIHAFREVEAKLGDGWATGEDYSIADMACYPAIANHERHKVDMADYPNVKRWFEAIKARPAVQRAYEKGDAIRKAAG